MGNDDDDDCHHQLTFSRRHHRPSRRGPAGHPVSLRPLTVDPDRMQRKTSGMGSRSILTVTATGQQLKQELVAGPALAAGRRRCLDCHMAAPQRRHALRRLPLPRLLLTGAGAHCTRSPAAKSPLLINSSLLPRDTQPTAVTQCSARSSYHHPIFSIYHDAFRPTRARTRRRHRHRRQASLQ